MLYVLFLVFENLMMSAKPHVFHNWCFSSSSWRLHGGTAASRMGGTNGAGPILWMCLKQGKSVRFEILNNTTLGGKVLAQRLGDARLDQWFFPSQSCFPYPPKKRIFLTSCYLGGTSEREAG